MSDTFGTIQAGVLPGSDIGYLRAGPVTAQRPPVILVHGAFTHGRMWATNLLPYLAAQGYPVYAIHLKNPDRGVATLLSYSLTAYCRRLRQLAVHVGGRPLLIGHSMGGLVIQQYLSQYPGQAAGAGLLASLPPWGLKHTLGYMLRHPDLLLAYIVVTLAPGLARRSRRRPPRGLLSLRVGPRAVAYFQGLLARESVFALAQAVAPPIDRAAVARVPLYICGAELDNLALPADVQRMAKGYGVPARILPDTGHFLVLEPGWEAVVEEMMRALTKT